MAAIEEFIKVNKLDQKAADALRECDSDVIQMVIEKGALNDCRNPSSAVTGRIRDAKLKALQSDSSPVDVEEFIVANGLDERAADGLRAASAAVQREAIHRGDLSDCRNPSAVILARIREATKRSGSGGGPKATPAQVEAFIAENSGMDERAAQALRDTTPQIQRVVIDRGGLADTRNPSAVILSRIKTAQREGTGGGNNSGEDNSWGWMNMMPMMGGMMGMPMMGGGGGGWGDDWGWGMPMMGGFGGWGGMGGKGGGKGKAAGIRKFIQDNNLDERATEELMGSTPMVQEAVMARGGLQETRNPSAVVLGRIRDAKKGMGMGRGMPY